MLEKDSLITGFLLGAITPVLGYVCVEAIFDVLMQMNLMEHATASTSGRRFRTLCLLAICTSLIPFNYSRKNRWDQTMRGIVFPTLFYVGLWIYKFGPELF